MRQHEQRIEFSYILAPASGEISFSHPESFGQLGMDLVCSTDQWRAMILESDRYKYDDYLKSVVNEEKSASVKYRLKLPCGKSVLLVEKGALVAQPGRWPVVSGSISQMDMKQAQMEHIEHLSLMGYLSAGLIHDFKNLIGGVQNIIEWCIVESSPQPEVSGALGKTIDYLEQANSLMGALLKLNESHGEESPVDLCLAGMVRDCEMLISHICSAAIKVELDIEEKLSTVKAQPNDIHEILLNLCVNARNAMSKQGDCLKIKLSSCKKKNKKYVCLSVKDNGCGIEKASLAKIFDAYYSSTGKGTGLGLWMVQKKVNEVEGLIEVKSELGQGTEFIVYIPASKKMAAALPSAAEAPEKKISKEQITFEEVKTILFIEDEPLIHNSISMWLKSLGFNVLAAEDGLKAYELFCQHENEIDLILQDYILPGMKGEELLSHFSASARDIPIVVMSAFSGDVNNSGILEKGASAYLPKPFKINQLIELINQFLGE